MRRETGRHLATEGEKVRAREQEREREKREQMEEGLELSGRKPLPFLGFAPT